MRTMTFSAPYGVDSKFNPFGDYDRLTLRVTQTGEGHIKSHWQLESKFGGNASIIPQQSLPSVLELFFLQNATSTETPNPNSKN